MAQEPQSVYLPGGRQLVCLACGNKQFTRRNTRLVSPRSFLAIGSLSELFFEPSTVAYVCAACGHIHQFVPKKPG